MGGFNMLFLTNESEYMFRLSKQTLHVERYGCLHQTDQETRSSKLTLVYPTSETKNYQLISNFT